jgi:hypothetical protein
MCVVVVVQDTSFVKQFLPLLEPERKKEQRENKIIKIEKETNEKGQKGNKIKNGRGGQNECINFLSFFLFLPRTFDLF